jgi:hypothetical protein
MAESIRVRRRPESESACERRSGNLNYDAGTAHQLGQLDNVPQLASGVQPLGMQPLENSMQLSG